jgi:tetratricopeptide (TPR) repeat protein
MSDTDLLAEIEEAIDAVAPLAELRARLEALSHLAEAQGEAGVRYLIARGIVENRSELPQSALASFQQARDLALRDKVVGQRARISREIARVRSWSGDITGASMELLRSVAEIEQSDAALARERVASGSAGGERPTRDDVARRGRLEVQIRADRAATVAEIGRLDIEAGRYEAALAALDEAACQAPGNLPPREAGRIAYNRCESWFGLGRTDRCRELIEESASLFSKKFPRDLFRIRLLKARCLLQDGDRDQAAAVAAEAREVMRGGDDSYEKGAEWQLFDGLMKERDDPQTAIAALRQARLRFADDNLPRHEVEAGIHLARILAAHGRMPEAETTVAEALARASGLPALADQVRTAAYSFWAADKQVDLAGENAAGQGSRFLVLTTLGSGGFGTVERAIDMATGEQVAIKRLRPDRRRTREAWAVIDTTVRREIETARKVPPRFAARTRYLNIDDKGELVLVQDFIDGPTLRKVLKDGTADRASRLGLAAHLTRGVAALHQHEVAHRDLKPENVILRGGREPVLIDLGLAALMGTSDVFSGMGTPGYAPPEQWKAGTTPKVFGSEDVYALGRVIVELGGALPPDRRLSTRLKARFGRAGRSDPDDVLREMIGRMIDSDPAKRDVDLGEVAGALDAAADRTRKTASS